MKDRVIEESGNRVIDWRIVQLNNQLPDSPITQLPDPEDTWL